MKFINIFFSFVFFISNLNAFPSHNDFYQKYFKIESKGFGKFLTYWGPIDKFIYPKLGTHVGYFDSYSGADSQQWLIAPVKPGSDEFFIINKYSGNPIYIDGNSVKYNESTIEKSKQIFKFQNFDGDYCQITLASDVGFLYYKRHTLYDLAGFANGYYYSLAYYTNKPSDDYSYFKLSVAADIPGASDVSIDNLINNKNQAGKIPFPPQLSSFNDQLSDYVNTTTIGETWIPFCLVNDPQRSRKLQVKETPYYKLIRKQAYYKIISETNTPGVAQEIERTEKYGVKNSETYKFQTTLNHSWSAGGAIEIKLSEDIPSLSINYSEKLEISNTQVSEFSTETELTKSTSRKISFNSTQQIRLLIFNLADIIRLERMNGTQVFANTTILDKDKTANSSWPTAGILKTYDPVLNKITIKDGFPPATPQNLTLTTPTNEPKLTWDANTETDLKEYLVYRSTEDEPYHHLATVDKSKTSFIDLQIVTAMPLDMRHYKIKAKNTSGLTSNFSNIVSIRGLERKESYFKEKYTIKTIEEITTYSLIQNYPNPFNPTTQINYQIPREGHVNLKIYNLLGKEVKTLVNEYKAIGIYNVEFNASNLPSGMYFYKLQSGEFSQVKKMLLVK